MFVDLRRLRERSIDRKLNRCLDLPAHLLVDALKRRFLGDLLDDEPVGELPQRVAIACPLLFLFTRTVVAAVHVADVMAPIAIRLRFQELRAAARSEERRVGKEWRYPCT